jgi:hypothetical protein
MAKVSISAIDVMIKEYAELYSVEDLFKLKEIKDLLDNGGNIPSKEAEEAVKLYMRFTAHKLIFQGGKDLEISVASAIGCGCEVELPQFKIPYSIKEEFRKFCAAYCRTCYNLGLYED